MACTRKVLQYSWLKWILNTLPCTKMPKRTFVIDETVPGQGQQAAKTFRELQMDPVMVQRFFNKFNEIDKDSSGEVDLEEFYSYFKINRSPFGDRVFSMFDQGKSGTMDFREFVVGVWNFCTYQLDTFIEFAFHVYDLDSSGQLEMEELRDLIEEVYGSMMANNVRVQRILDAIDSDGDGVISSAEFADFNRRYPALLFPAFSMQNELRRRCFGEKFWQKELGRRMDMTDGRMMDIFDRLDVMDGGSKAATGLDQLIAMNEHHEEADMREKRLKALRAGGASHAEAEQMMKDFATENTTYAYNPRKNDAQEWCERVRKERKEALLKQHAHEQRMARRHGRATAKRHDNALDDSPGIDDAHDGSKHGGSWYNKFGVGVKKRGKSAMVMPKRHDLPMFLVDL